MRRDGVPVGICEVLGLELDEPKLAAFAGTLNALDFPVQLLVRQHSPDLARLRASLAAAQPRQLPPAAQAAAESLRQLLTTLETRDGILDRRFYASCPRERALPNWVPCWPGPGWRCIPCGAAPCGNCCWRPR